MKKNQKEIQIEIDKDSKKSQNHLVENFDNLMKKDDILEDLMEIENMIKNKIKNLRKE